MKRTHSSPTCTTLSSPALEFPQTYMFYSWWLQISYSKAPCVLFTMLCILEKVWITSCSTELSGCQRNPDSSHLLPAGDAPGQLIYTAFPCNRVIQLLLGKQDCSLSSRGTHCHIQHFSSEPKGSPSQSGIRNSQGSSEELVST